MERSFCQCKGQCKTYRCKCRKNGLSCSTLCRCKSCVNHEVKKTLAIPEITSPPIAINPKQAQIVPRDLERSSEMSYYEEESKSEAEKQFLKGLWHLQQKEEKVACQWFDLAAKQNHVGAMFNLGLLYLKGFGPKKDAQRLFVTAAKLGHFQSQKIIAQAVSDS